MSQALHARVRAIRARIRIRAWEIRQRRHAKGVWYPLRRVLAQAAEAYAIPETVAALLMAEGCRPEAVGAELAPPKAILFVPRDRIEPGVDWLPLALSLDANLLAAPWIALVRFP